MKARAPVLGGNFGVWGGLFSTFDCAVKGYGMLHLLPGERKLNTTIVYGRRRTHGMLSLQDSSPYGPKTRLFSWRNTKTIYSGRLTRRPRRSESHAQRRHWMRHSTRSHRRSRHRIPTHDGRKHKTRTSTTHASASRSFTQCPRAGIKWDGLLVAPVYSQLMEHDGGHSCSFSDLYSSLL
jgi:hypothetical protein